MREIKFRAWEPSARRMFQAMVGTPANPSIWTESNWRDCTPEASIMQFTGLKDKNGKEIYEGDVLDTVEFGGSYYPNRVVVEYHALAFAFVGKIKGASPYCDYTFDTITATEVKRVHSMEIVGNIYENPELVKK